MKPTSVDDVVKGFSERGYIADEGLATAVFLSMTLSRPLFLEGEPGVGKTEVAKVLTDWLNTDLIRLQCYEGIDVSQALYEWDYPRQLLHLRAAGDESRVNEERERIEGELYSERFLLRRPLLQAISTDRTQPAVLLIDEIDRADDEFEAFLLEILSDWTVTIPELGTVKAATPPIVVLTSNRTRDVHDALKRRCLYHWVDHPSIEQETEIVLRKVPKANEVLARQVAQLVAEIRNLGLYKPPGVAETIDWVEAICALSRTELDAQSAAASMGAAIKYHEDADRVMAADFSVLVADAKKQS